jgi:ABC-type protease/lipase transport system fused ATPase/permease subunit
MSVVVVGHRPSTLAQADKLVVLREGRVVLFGPRDEVLQAMSEASAYEGGSDTVPLRRVQVQSSALKSDHTAEMGAS